MEIRDANGNWHVKCSRGGKPMESHSMFPADWDEARIRSEITSAWRSNKVKKSMEMYGSPVQNQEC